MSYGEKGLEPHPSPEEDGLDKESRGETEAEVSSFYDVVMSWNGRFKAGKPMGADEWHEAGLERLDGGMKLEDYDPDARWSIYVSPSKSGDGTMNVGIKVMSGR